MSPVPLPVAHIARNMGLSRQGVQRIANELEGQRIVRFAPNPHHQRAKLVVLTEHGSTLFEAASSRQKPWATALGDDLSARTIETATKLLREVRSRLEADATRGEDNEL